MSNLFLARQRPIPNVLENRRSYRCLVEGYNWHCNRLEDGSAYVDQGLSWVPTQNIALAFSDDDYDALNSKAKDGIIDVRSFYISIDTLNEQPVFEGCVIAPGDGYQFYHRNQQQWPNINMTQDSVGSRDESSLQPVSCKPAIPLVKLGRIPRCGIDFNLGLSGPATVFPNRAIAMSPENRQFTIKNLVLTALSSGKHQVRLTYHLVYLDPSLPSLPPPLKKLKVDSDEKKVDLSCDEVIEDEEEVDEEIECDED